MTDARSTALPTALDSVGQTDSLDQVVGPLEQIAGQIPEGIRHKLSGVGWLGHPVHQPLVHLPVGSWMAASIMDLAGRPEEARDLTVLGVIAAVPAAVTGLADWAEFNPDTKRIGAVHAVANSVGLVLYISSIVARCGGRHRLGQKLGLLGLAAVATGGAIGGDLARRRAAALSSD